MILTSSKIFVFDLDDTLYSERDFEKSGIEPLYDDKNDRGGQNLLEWI